MMKRSKRRVKNVCGDAEGDGIIWHRGVRIHKNGRVDLQLRRAGLHRKNAREQFMALDDYLKIVLKPVTHRSSGVCDVSCNRIDDKAVELLIEIVIKHHLLFRVIKLYDNNIQDGGGLAVARYITWYPYGVDELNMSHNDMTAKGVAHIVAAYHQHPEKPYPWFNRKLNVFVPGFVRVDENFAKIGGDIINCLMTRKETMGWTGWTDNSQDLGPQRLAEVFIFIQF